jgi:hypothetical protein
VRPSIAIACLISLFLLACQSGAVVGSTCSRDTDCASPLSCRAGRCRSQCAESRDCPPGTRCLFFAGAGSCSIDSDNRCQSGGDVCPTGLACLADHCVNTCRTASDCAADAMCIDPTMTGVSFCYTPDLGDAGAIDASTDAGGQVGVDAGRVDGGPGYDGGACSGSACDVAIDLCVGDAFVCAVRADHVVRCWGDNAHGQLGDGMGMTVRHTHVSCGGSDCSAAPVTVLAEDGTILQADRVACGEGVACAVRTDGSVACWGENGSGEAGVASPTELDRATIVGTLPDPMADPALDVRAMRTVMCAELRSGARWCWGYDSDDVLALGMADTTVLPSAIAAFAQGSLALGLGHVCALGTDGSVMCAGNWREGELGYDPAMGAPMARTTRVSFTPAPTQLAAGEQASCALVGGAVRCWGADDVLQLGRGVSRVCGPTSAPCDWTPVALTMPTGVTTLWGEGNTAMFCAASATDTHCWGATDAGDCFLAGGTCDRPTRVPALAGARHVATGQRGVCAIDAGGAVRCFGANASGQLGTSPSGAITTSDAPTTVCIRDACP